ncbi:unnamed protein product [Dicrocoelium dendriticum]|nr:unnamed protein product [Dicrocoelium dendriticum]
MPRGLGLVSPIMPCNGYIWFKNDRLDTMRRRTQYSEFGYSGEEVFGSSRRGIVFGGAGGCWGSRIVEVGAGGRSERGCGVWVVVRVAGRGPGLWGWLLGGVWGGVGDTFCRNDRLRGEVWGGGSGVRFPGGSDGVGAGLGVDGEWGGAAIPPGGAAARYYGGYCWRRARGLDERGGSVGILSGAIEPVGQGTEGRGGGGICI